MADNNIENNTYKCPLADKCKFIQLHEKDMPGLVARLKKEYCFKDNAHCARKRIRDAFGPEAIPDTMMPNQNNWAKQLLEDAATSKFTKKEQ